MLTAEIVIAIAMTGVVAERIYAYFVQPMMHRRNGRKPINTDAIEASLDDINKSVQEVKTEFTNYAQITDWKIGTLAGRINTLESKG